MLTYIMLYATLFFSVGCIKKTDDCGWRRVTKKVKNQKGMVIQEADSYYISANDAGLLQVCNSFPNEFKKDSLMVIYSGRYLHRTTDPRVRYLAELFFLDEIEIY